MNSVANGKVYRRTPFKRMYLPAAAGDAGGAIGAAVVVLRQLESGKSPAAGKLQAEEPATVEEIRLFAWRRTRPLAYQQSAIRSRTRQKPVRNASSRSGLTGGSG